MTCPQCGSPNLQFIQSTWKNNSNMSYISYKKNNILLPDEKPLLCRSLERRSLSQLQRTHSQINVSIFHFVMLLPLFFLIESSCSFFPYIMKWRIKSLLNVIQLMFHLLLVKSPTKHNAQTINWMSDIKETRTIRQYHLRR